MVGALVALLVLVCVGWVRSARSRRTHFDRPL